MKIHDYIVHETERQSGTMKEALGMYTAWNFFATRWKNNYRLNSDILISSYCAIKSVEKSREYRKTPVTFNQGGYAVPPAHVEKAMERLAEVLNSVDSEVNGKLFDNPRDIADYLTREFLIIHPFLDGNGRVGSLMWNFLNGTIMNPEPMPYFFGDDNG